MPPVTSLPAPPGTEIRPVMAENWTDLKTLFGPHGAFMGCWCAYWRLRHVDFEATSAAEHKAVIRDRVHGDLPPGLLAYRDDEPVAWVSVEPRERFEAFAHARVYRPVDETPVWTVTCFYVAEDARGEGLMAPLLVAVTAHVRERGGVAVEGYPEYPACVADSGTPGYMGLVPAFEAAGFEQIATLSNDRPVYRATLED